MTLYNTGLISCLLPKCSKPLFFLVFLTKGPDYQLHGELLLFYNQFREQH